MQQDPQIEDLDEITCSKHNQKIVLCSLDEGIKLEERLLCKTCIQATQIQNNSLTWSQAKEIYHEKLQQLLLQQIGERKVQINEQSQLKQVNHAKITYQLENEIGQHEQCRALAFNNDGTLMVAGCEEKIKLWYIGKGKLKATRVVFQGHFETVYCLVFSKQINWFASSGSDSAVRCWKEMNQNNWISSQPVTKHNSYVFGLLLNGNEDQLFSGSADRSIKVWKVNTHKNELIYDYSLDKHEESVYQMCFNESETSLISCGSDCLIIIWGKGQQNRWEFKEFITKQKHGYDFGNRICFLDENMLVWQRYTKGISVIFQLENGVFKERPELEITLNQDGCDDTCLFPSVYIQKRKMLLQKHNKYVYLIRHKEDGKFQIEQQIDCKSPLNYGGITNCGQHMVIWNDTTKKLALYLIKYE